MNRQSGAVIIHQGKVYHLSVGGAIRVIFNYLQEKFGGLTGFNELQQAAHIQSEFEHTLFVGGIALHVVFSTLEVEHGPVDGMVGLDGAQVGGDTGLQFDFVAAGMVNRHFIGQSRVHLIFHVHHIDALVPDAAVGGQFRQFAIRQVAIAMIGETRAEGVAEDDRPDLPVADIDHAVTVEVAVVGVLAVAVVVPADGVVVADDGLAVVDIGFEVGHDPHTGLWGAFRNLAQHLLIAIGHMGGVEVGQAAMFVAAEVVVEPVLQCQQALFRVGRDG